MTSVALRLRRIGLRWSDIDLRASTLTVNPARVLVEYRVRIEELKSRNGKHTLPLDGELVAALATFRKGQLDEGAASDKVPADRPLDGIDATSLDLMRDLGWWPDLTRATSWAGSDCGSLTC